MNLIDTFCRTMTANAGRVTCIDQMAEAVTLIETFAAENKITGTLRLSPALAPEWPGSQSLPTQIGTAIGTTDGTDKLCASRAWAGVADTGSLVLLSGPGNPTRLNFLADFHLVFLHAKQIVANKTAVWEQLATVSDMPRAVNFISGPSRTADIEQTIQLGAHGPRFLWVFVQV